MSPEIIESLDRFCVYGVATDYDGMIELVRYRLEELNTTHESVDDVSGLHGGYCSKLVAPKPIKSMGKASMGPMLQTLGLALIVVRDDAQFAKIKDRLAKRERPRQSPSMHGQARPKWLFTKKTARELRKSWWSTLTDAQRKKHQRKAQKGQAAARRRARREREKASRKGMVATADRSQPSEIKSVP